MNIKPVWPALLTVAMAAGCAAPQPVQQRSTITDSRALAQAQAEQDRLRAQNANLQAQLDEARGEPVAIQASGTSFESLALTPPNARPGECYARVTLPARYETRRESLLKQAESERVEVIPAQYEWAQETILVAPATEKVVEVIPPQYRTVEEQVLVRPASERVEAVPATYRTVSEQVLVSPARTEWKPGRGAVERVGAGGEILCLVEVPAVYKTVSQRVIDRPAGTRTVPVPAEYATVKRQELVKEAEVRKVTVPAQYKTVRVQKLVHPAQERRIAIPAQYQDVEQRVLVTAERSEWGQVVCKTNEEAVLVRRVQEELKKRGHHPGPVDGLLGPLTINGVRAYERANNLPQAPAGAIPYTTLKALGVATPAST